MISSIQNLLQKHYKWLFSVLLAIIIVSFVFTIGASPGLGSKNRRAPKKMFCDVDLGDPQQVDQLVQAAYMTAMLDFDPSVYDSNGLEFKALSRVLMLAWGEDLQVPMPNEKWLKKYIEARPLFSNEKRQFDPKRYAEFQEQVKKNPSLRAATVRRTMLEDGRIDVVRSALACDFVFPTEARLHFLEKQAKWDIEVVTVRFDSYNPKIEPTAKELQKFYEEHKDEYQSEAQVLASYATFLARDFAHKVAAPTSADLKAFQKQNPNAGKSKPSDPEPTAEVLREAYIKAKARILAEKAANDFAYQLYTQKTEYASLRFQSLLKAAGGTMHKLSPYTMQKLPEDPNLSKAILVEAFGLDTEKYYTDVERTAEGATMLFVEKLTPVRALTFTEARAQVAKDYTAVEKTKQFVAHGGVLKRELLTAIKNHNLKETAELKGFSFQSYSALCFADQPKAPAPSVLAALMELSSGMLSDMVPVEEGGAFVFVSKKDYPKIDRNAVHAAAVEIQPTMTRMVERSILMEAIQKELAKSEAKKSGK